MKLHRETVSEEMFDLLEKLMKEDELRNFRLVGGTALSLLTGHRKSIDIDLFTGGIDTNFDTQNISTFLSGKYDFKETSLSRLGLFGLINNIKTDFFNHGHNWLDDGVTVENIRIASIREIAAMKLHAVSTNGTRLKDFVDLAFLGSYLSATEMINAYRNKYVNSNPLIALKAMFYYGDIDFDQSIELVTGNFKWQPFEKRLDQMQRYTNKIFPPLLF